MSTKPDSGTTHAEQSLPYEWNVYELGDDTIVAHSTDEPTPDCYRVDGTTRNARVVATADAVLYEGRLVEPVYVEQYGTVELQHFFGGREDSYRPEEWLDEPVVLLEALDRGDVTEAFDS